MRGPSPPAAASASSSPAASASVPSATWIRNGVRVRSAVASSAAIPSPHGGQPTGSRSERTTHSRPYSGSVATGSPAAYAANPRRMCSATNVTPDRRLRYAPSATTTSCGTRSRSARTAEGWYASIHPYTFAYGPVPKRGAQQPKRWSCPFTNPGIAARPGSGTTRAPGGGASPAPTATIRSPSITTVASRTIVRGVRSSNRVSASILGAG